MRLASLLQELLRDGKSACSAISGLWYKVFNWASSSSAENTWCSLSTTTMPSLTSSFRSISKAAFAYSQIALFSGASVHGGSPAVCSNPQLSCQTTTAVQDTCCFNAPGGQLLQTQFWDTNPPTGPIDSWTVHGLW